MSYQYQPAQPLPPVTLSAAAGDASIFGTLGVVLLITLGVYFFKRDKTEIDFGMNHYLAARDSQGVISMTLSYFTSNMGAWVIFAAPQAAVIGGSFGLAGYALSPVVLLLAFGAIAPVMRKQLPNGITMMEFVHMRFGVVNAVYTGMLSIFYMGLYLTAELASAGTLATGLSQIETIEPLWTGPNVFGGMPLAPILGVSLITLAYTSMGGLPVSILTDRIQGVGVCVLTLVITVAAYATSAHYIPASPSPPPLPFPPPLATFPPPSASPLPPSPFTPPSPFFPPGMSPAASPPFPPSAPPQTFDDRFGEAAGHGVHPLYVPTNYGNSIAIAFSLIMGVVSGNLFNMGNWQRVWAAESNSAVVSATYLASFLSMGVLFLTGVTGWIAYAHYGSNLITPQVYDLTFLSAPCLIRQYMGDGWSALAIIFGTAMIASTADTLQSGMAAMFWPAVSALHPSASNGVKMVCVIGLTALVNVPAIVIALSGQSILQLFLLADLLCATAVVPIFMGLDDRTHPLACFVGMLSGMATVFVVYAIAGEWGEGITMLVDVQGGIFNRSAAYAFGFTPIVSGALTLAISRLAYPNYTFAGFPKAAADGSTADKGTPALVATTSVPGSQQLGVVVTSSA